LLTLVWPMTEGRPAPSLHIGFMNPQANFDPEDRYWTEHPDFGGQLVYVKEVALALGRMGHWVDILTRRIVDPQWPGFEDSLDGYPGEPQVRIVRLPCGGDHFLRKEDLWPYLGTEWVPSILGFYEKEGRLPNVFSAHYADGGLSAALLQNEAGIPFSFTAHSLGAQKMDKLGVTPKSLEMEHAHFHFARRIAAERVSMNHAARIITSTSQERMEQYGHAAYRGVNDPANPERFSVIPPGVNLRVFSPTPTDQDKAVAKRMESALWRDISAGRRHLPVIITSSRLDRKKNHLGLWRAFSASEDLQARANLALVVRGLEDPLHHYEALDSDERSIMEDITALMAQAELWGKVTAFPLNSQSELAAAYRVLAQRRSVFALTALYEPFGLAPLEAMSAGLPVVVTRNGGPSESMREDGQEFGVLVDPSDREDIARGLMRVLGSEESWKRFRHAGMGRVLSRYTWERTAEGYTDVLQTLPQQAARGREIAIPEYFRHPDPGRDTPLAELGAVYFEERRAEATATGGGQTLKYAKS
jgi:sucrose-phosphate synthase